MIYTDFLNLKKPDYTDPANIQDLNENSDTLDAFLQSLNAEQVAYLNDALPSIATVKQMLDSLWANKANKGPLIKYPVSFRESSNVQDAAGNIYWKDEFGIVTVYCVCNPKSGYFTGSNLYLGDLPVGFRPINYHHNLASMWSGATLYMSNIVIEVDGAFWVSIAQQNINRIVFTAIFPSE